ncbi:hypothetical protein ACH5RR_027894 [Cinchona calisaya]|uniref:Uncharacterized protein n=1 Tax=Cinchona calisaya TaxID=153742 RepID=A0ABD2YNE1_9GENT
MKRALMHKLISEGYFQQPNDDQNPQQAINQENQPINQENPNDDQDQEEHLHEAAIPNFVEDLRGTGFVSKKQRGPRTKRISFETYPLPRTAIVNKDDVNNASSSTGTETEKDQQESSSNSEKKDLTYRPEQEVEEEEDDDDDDEDLENETEEEEENSENDEGGSSGVNPSDENASDISWKPSDD